MPIALFKHLRQKFSQLTLAILLLLICNLLLVAAPTSSLLLAQTAGEDAQFFPDTNHTVSGPFLRYWRANNGGIAFGLPITDQVKETDPVSGQEVYTQWFERTKFELRPGPNGSSIVKLATLGEQLRQEALKTDPDFLPAKPLVDPDFKSEIQRFFPETRHNLRFRFLEFWQQNGGEERFGFPISEERLEFEPETGTYYRVQWFQRARFEYHPENTPPNDVLLGLLGKQIREPNREFDFLWKLGHGSSFLSYPNALFVDGKGTVYVNDRASNRINKYAKTASGLELVNYWYMDSGTQAIAGIRREASNTTSKDTPLLFSLPPYQKDTIYRLMPSGNWETVKLAPGPDPDSASPNQGLAVDTEGNFYVLKYAHSSNYLVWKYGPKGDFLGKYVERSQVNDPYALAVANNTLYLADGPSNKYLIFNLGSGGGKEQVDSALVPEPATPSGQTRSVLGIALDPKGKVFASEPGRIVRFNERNTFEIDLPVAKGRGEGQLLNPVALAVDLQGNLYATDPSNHRVSIFDGAGNYIGKIEDERRVNQDGGIAQAGGVTATPGSNGVILVADPVNRRVSKFSLSGEFKESWPAQNVGLIAASPGGEAFYGLNSVDGLILKYDLNGKELWRRGGNGSEQGKFNLPGGIAVGEDEMIYVADTGNQRIQKFNDKGDFVAAWGMKGSRDNEFGGSNKSDVFSGPTSLAVEPQTGQIYVVDPVQFRIVVFKPDGSLLTTLKQLEEGRPFEPVAVAAPLPLPKKSQTGGNTSSNLDGLYIATGDGLYKLKVSDNSVAARVVARASIPAGDSGDGNLTSLTGLTVDRNGNLFALDSFNRLQKFRLK